MLISTKLDKKYPWVKETQACSKEGSPLNDLITFKEYISPEPLSQIQTLIASHSQNGTAYEDWLETMISTTLNTKHPGVDKIQVCSHGGQCLFSMTIL